MTYFDAYQSFERRASRGEFDPPKKPKKPQKKDQPPTNETTLEAAESTPATVESGSAVGKPVAQFIETVREFIEPKHPKAEAKTVVQAVAPQAEEFVAAVAEPAPEILKPKNPELDLMVHQFVTEMGSDLITTFVAGMEGDVIASESNDPYFNSKIAAASIPLILQLGAGAGGKIGLGQVDNNMTSTDQVYIIAKFIGGSSFCWGVVVRRNSPLGFIRMTMNEYEDKIRVKIKQ